MDDDFEVVDYDVVDAPQSAQAAPEGQDFEIVDYDVVDAPDAAPKRQYGLTETALAHTAKGAIPTAGSVYTGLLAGGALGTMGAGPVGTVVGGLAAGIAAGLGLNWGQDKILAALGLDEPLNEMARQNPTTAAIGEALPATAFLRPNTSQLVLGERALGAAIGGGFEGVTQAIHGEFQPERLGVATVGGAAFPSVNRLGQAVLDQGSRLGARYRGGNAGAHVAGDNPIPDPNEGPAAQEPDIQVANDITTTAPGVAADNPPAPEIHPVGNPGTSPGPHQAAGPDSSYIKGAAPERIDPGLVNLQPQRGNISPDIEVAIVASEQDGAPSSRQQGVIPDDGPIDSGLPRVPHNPYAQEDALLQMSRMQREAEAKRHPDQGVEFGADVPPTDHTERTPVPPPGSREATAAAGQEPRPSRYSDADIAEYEQMQGRGERDYDAEATRGLPEPDFEIVDHPAAKAPEPEAVARDAEKPDLFAEFESMGPSEMSKRGLDKPAEDGLPRGWQKDVEESLAALRGKIPDEQLARLEALPPKEQYNALTRLNNAMQSASGEGMGQVRESGVVRKNIKRKMADNGAQANSDEELERMNRGIKLIRDAGTEWGPDSKAGKIDLTDKNAVKDYAKKVWQDVVNKSGVPDPLDRVDKRTYVPSKKGHIDTDVLEWLRAVRAVAKGGKDGMSRFRALHQEGLHIQKDKLTAPAKIDENAEPSIARTIQDERDADIRQNKQAHLDEPITDAIANERAEEPTNPGDVIERTKIGPYKDPERDKNAGTRKYGEEQDALRAWFDDLDEAEWRLLVKEHNDVYTRIEDAEDPGKLHRDLIDDLNRLTKPKASKEVFEYPPEDAPGGLKKKVTAPVIEGAPKPAADPGRRIDRNSVEFQRIAAEALANIDKPKKNFSRLNDTAAAFFKDESGALQVPQVVDRILSNIFKNLSAATAGKPAPKPAAAKPAAAKKQAAPPPVVDDAYIKSVDNTLYQSDQNTKQVMIDVKEITDAGAKFIRESGLTDHDMRQIRDRIQDRRLYKLTDAQRTIYEDYITPLFRTHSENTRQSKVLNDKHGLGYELPDLTDSTMTAYFPRQRKNAELDKPGDIYDPIGGKRLTGYSPNFLDRDFFTLAGGSNRYVFSKNKDGEFMIMRNGKPQKLADVPDTFAGDLGDTIKLRVRQPDGTYKHETFTVDQARDAEIETATKGAMRYQENPLFTAAVAAVNSTKALHHLEALVDIKTNPKYKKLITADKDVAKELGYDLVPTRLPEFMTTGGAFPQEVYMPRTLRYIFDDWHRAGFGGNSEGLTLLRNISMEFNKIFNLNAPWVHVMNEGVMNAIGQGGHSFANPKGLRHLHKDMAEAITALRDPKSKLLKEYLDAGGDILSPSGWMPDYFRLLANDLKVDVQRPPGVLNKPIKVGGYEFSFKDFYDGWYRLTTNMTWYPVDAMTLTRYLQEKRAGWTPEEAVKRVNKYGADYRIGHTLFGKRSVQQFATDPAVTMFGRWKARMWRSLQTLAHDLGKGDDMWRQRAKREGASDTAAELHARKEALGNLLVMAGITFAMFPAINKGLEAVTGKEGIEMRPRGISAPLTAMKDIATGDAETNKLLTSTWSPAPHITTAVDLLRNKDWRGKPIIPQGQMPGVIPDQVGALSEYMARTAFPIYGSLSKGWSDRDRPGLKKGLENLAWEQIGVSEPSEGAKKWRERTPKRNALQEKERRKRSGGIIPDALNSWQD